MSRRFFLIGNLTGLALGIVLMVFLQSRYAPPQAEPKPIVVPISVAANEADENPLDRMAIPLTTPIPLEDFEKLKNRRVMPNLHERKPIPPEWTWKEFNGRRVYLIPLSMNEVPTLR